MTKLTCSYKCINVYFSNGIAVSEKTQTSVMLENSLKRRAKKFIADFDKMNFSGLLQGVLKLFLFVIGPKDLPETWRTKVVTLCKNPEEAPIVMLELLQRLYTKDHPDLSPHFEAIIKTVKDGNK